MLALYANTIATAVMVGVIWFVQVVHYPLLAQFGSTQSVAVAEQHQQRTGYVVGLPMLVEGLSTLWLLVRRPDGAAALLPWAEKNLVPEDQDETMEVVPKKNRNVKFGSCIIKEVPACLLQSSDPWKYKKANSGPHMEYPVAPPLALLRAVRLAQELSQ